MKACGGSQHRSEEPNRSHARGPIGRLSCRCGPRAPTIEGIANYPAQDTNGNLAVKLMRTFTIQVEALQRYRGKGQQKITVEHVHVHAGDQAIVGAVSAERRESGGGITKKLRNKPTHLKEAVRRITRRGRTASTCCRRCARSTAPRPLRWPNNGLPSTKPNGARSVPPSASPGGAPGTRSFPSSPIRRRSAE